MSNDVLFQPLGSPVPLKQGLGRINDIDPRLRRTHYFDGRLLTAKDLTRDQLYLDQRLREAGKSLGSGVMNGLEAILEQDQIRVGPGIGVTQAGRVLQLTEELSVALGDRALIAELNQGQHRHLARGLYAVILRYAEVPTDIAEVFPRDLAAQRTVQYDVVAEAVQLGLAPLPQPLAQAAPTEAGRIAIHSELSIRASLIRAFLGGGEAAGVIPEDGIALGVLAIFEDRPQWLDPQLLRHPLRSAPMPGDVEMDVLGHYETLFRDVIAYREAASLGGDFAASEYFQLLPPAGSLPKESIEPKTGRQSYFPESFRVSVAIIRQSDLQLVIKESMKLPHIDLARDEPVDVVVLAPLPNLDFGHYARSLERDFEPATRRLPFMDPLRLRLYPRRPVHALDTDAATWEAIWDRVGKDALRYIRRPIRAAETAISGIVLARGTELPEPTAPAASSTPEIGGLLLDEDAVLLSRINFVRLADLRPPSDSSGETALAMLKAEMGDDAQTLLASLRILVRVERRYDSVIWQTLLPLARGERLPAFIDGLEAAQKPGVATGEAVVSIGATMGLDAALLNQWRDLDAGGTPS